MKFTDILWGQCKHLDADPSHAKPSADVQARPYFDTLYHPSEDKMREDPYWRTRLDPIKSYLSAWVASQNEEPKPGQDGQDKGEDGQGEQPGDGQQPGEQPDQDGQEPGDGEGQDEGLSSKQEKAVKAACNKMDKAEDEMEKAGMGGPRRGTGPGEEKIIPVTEERMAMLQGLIANPELLNIIRALGRLEQASWMAENAKIRRLGPKIIGV